jgi:hypothetical protein
MRRGWLQACWRSRSGVDDGWYPLAATELGVHKGLVRDLMSAYSRASEIRVGGYRRP